MSRQHRTFFADTLDAALAKARRELGPEALLLEAGPAAPAERRHGAFRVICADEGTASQAGDKVTPDRLWSAEGRSLGSICQRLERLEQTVAMMARTITPAALPGPLAGLSNLLAAHDFPEFLLQDLLAGVRDRLGGDSTAEADAVRAAAAQQVLSRLSFRADLAGQRRPVVIVLAGPPGAGKTSVLVKMAMREAIAKRRPAAIISTDGFRVAASEQLRTYASILGLPYALAETPAALRQAAAENARCDLIFVDTPGFSRNEQDWALEWARMLDEIPGRETLLVLPASLRTMDLLDAMRWWSVFSPTALVFSRMDETDRIGGWVSAAMESGLPISFFGTGQRIPEDLEAASEMRILEVLGCSRAGASGGLAAGAAR
ncbi:MAG: hypothetical protein KatS3mg004_1499 [Bryobacteraceae bacterium]|nr:MAG: hypothetical protein KatS3mg004_1499 [Bryobacteraceae bacterium]